MRLRYRRHVALIDAVRGRDNPALPCLAEDPGQPDHGHDAAVDQAAQHHAGPTDGSGRALKLGLKSRAQSAQSCHADSKSFERCDAT